MRKGNLLLSITLLVSIVLSTALSASDLRWQAGLKGGANWAKLVGDPVSLWLGDSADGQLAGSVGDYKLGFTGGGFVTVFFNDFFGLQTELMYVPKGGQGAVSGQIIFQPDYDNPRPAFFNGELYAELDYVEIPLLAVFEFEAVEGGKIRLRGYAGTTFAFNVHAEARLQGTAEITMQDESTRYQDVDQTQEIGEYVKEFEFGLMFGGAVYWDIGKVDLLLESRWSRGLTTLDNTTLYRNINTSNVSLLLGFSYPFGG